MTFDELIGAVERAYNATNIQGRINIPCPDAEDLIFLLRCILDNNYFEFNNKVYKQTIGASMGQISSPHTCEIRMFEILLPIITNTIIKYCIMVAIETMVLYYLTGTGTKWKNFSILETMYMNC